jgi:hypothetical protein
VPVGLAPCDECGGVPVGLAPCDECGGVPVGLAPCSGCGGVLVGVGPVRAFGGREFDPEGGLPSDGDSGFSKAVTARTS